MTHQWKVGDKIIHKSDVGTLTRPHEIMGGAWWARWEKSGMELWIGEESMVLYKPQDPFEKRTRFINRIEKRHIKKAA